MPLKPKKQCTHPDCPKLTTGGPCEEHKRHDDKLYDDSRGSRIERGYDAIWQKVRRVKLNNDPLCEECMTHGMDVVAVLVHHKQTIEDHPELRLVLSNLMSLCRECHEKIHRKERFKQRA